MYESKKQSKDEVKKKAGKPFLNSIYFVFFLNQLELDVL